jgi:hypothetical protein
MGYKYDDRLPAAFCRLVLLYFMSMIRYKGSKSGVTLAAEVNLAQYNIIDYGKEKEILKNRLEDTSIPVNSVYVTAHTPEGYIDVVYFSDKKPIDACIEYVRPLGMYCFQHSGVAFNARNKISIDARLTNIDDRAKIPKMITRVGHYSRNDYARMQKMYDVSYPAPEYYMQSPKRHVNDTSDVRQPAWARNSEFEGTPTVDAGYRAMSSLQMSNNEHITRSLFTEPIFDLGYEPQDITIEPYSDLKPNWNLRYNITNEPDAIYDVTTIDEERTETATRPRPAVNPIMAQLGDAIEMPKDDEGHRRYLVTDTDDPNHELVIKPADEI